MEFLFDGTNVLKRFSRKFKDSVRSGKRVNLKVVETF